MGKHLLLTLVLVIVAMISLMAGCTGEVYSYDNFIDDLLDSGASLQIEGKLRVAPFNEYAKNQIIINGERVAIFEFDNEAQADEEAACILPDGTGIDRRDEEGTGTVSTWSGGCTHHFYKKGRVIAYYKDYEHISSTSDIPTQNLLVRILGKQFAGYLPPIVTSGGRPEVYLKNKQEVSSEVLLRSFQIDEDISDKQHYWYPRHTVNVGEPILIVRGTIQNKHKENTWIDMWAEGYDEMGEQVVDKLNSSYKGIGEHLRDLINLARQQAAEFDNIQQ